MVGGPLNDRDGGDKGKPLEVPRRPLVLGLGNLLLHDEAVGLVLLDWLRRETGEWGQAVDFLDGGTLGLALLGVLSGRPSMVVLDAIACGGQPGSVHVMDAEETLALSHKSPVPVRSGGAGQLLSVAKLTGDLPAHVRVVVVEPEQVNTGMGLSEPVRGALPAALQAAREAIAEMLGLPGAHVAAKSDSGTEA